MQAIWKAWVFLKLGLLTDISYKLSFAFQVVDILLGIAAFYFLARLLGERTPQGYASFPFILVGMAVNGYMTTSMVCFAQGIRGDQLMGTLKAMLATRTSPLALILLSSLYPLVRATVDAGLYLLGGMLFGLSLGQANIPAALLFFLISLIAFSSSCAPLFSSPLISVAIVYGSHVGSRSSPERWPPSPIARSSDV